MTVAPKSIRSRVINFVACGSGSDSALGQVNTGIINPAAGETAAGVWNKPSVQIPIQRGVTSTLFHRPFGAPLPARIIRYQGSNAIPSKFHFDARSMSAGLGLTFFEGWDETIQRLTEDHDQRILTYQGRMFPIFDTTLTPWSWPQNINSPAFQNCPGALMQDLSYIRYQFAGFDYGLAEAFFDADGQAKSPTSGRYDTIYRLSDALTIAADFTHADFTGTFANAYARVCGLESMPLRSTTAWAAGKTGMTWLALSNGVDEAFDLRIGDTDYLQPDEMDVMPVVMIQGTNKAAYDLAMSLLETYDDIRVTVKFLAMLNNGHDMAALLAAGAIVEGDNDGDGDDSDEIVDPDTCGAIGFAHSGCSGTVGVAKECCTTDDGDDDDDDDNDGNDPTGEVGPSVPIAFGLAPTYSMIIGDPTSPDGTWDGGVNGPFAGGGGNGGFNQATPSTVVSEVPPETPAEPDPDLTPFDDYAEFYGDGGPHPDGSSGGMSVNPASLFVVSNEASGPHSVPTVTS